MCDLESNSSIRNPGPIDWVHFHVPRTTLNALQTMLECVRLNASTVFMELPTPFSTT